MNSIESSQPAAIEIAELGDREFFFSVSLTKLVLLSTCTFGLYEIYWFYKNWQLVKHHEKSEISPVWRSIFGTLFCYSLLRRVQSKAQENAVPMGSAGFLAVGWIVVTILARLPDPYWLVSFLAVFFLVPVQSAINSINEKHFPEHDRNSRPTAWNMVAVAIGGPLFVFCVYAAFYVQDVA
jgi:hypothetical protein